MEDDHHHRYTHIHIVNMNMNVVNMTTALAYEELYDCDTVEEKRVGMRLHFHPKRAFNFPTVEYDCEVEDITTAVPYKFTFTYPKARKEIGFTYMVTLKRWKQEWRAQQEREIAEYAVKMAARWV